MLDRFTDGQRALRDTAAVFTGRAEPAADTGVGNGRANRADVLAHTEGATEMHHAVIADLLAQGVASLAWHTAQVQRRA